MRHMRILIEAAVETLDDALAAIAGGADRLELCADLDAGGTTPARALVAEVLAQVSVPVLVMIRPRAGDFVYSRAELDRMRDDLAVAIELGASGIVLGALDSSGGVDVPATRELIAAAAGRRRHLPPRDRRDSRRARRGRDARVARRGARAVVRRGANRHRGCRHARRDGRARGRQRCRWWLVAACARTTSRRSCSARACARCTRAAAARRRASEGFVTPSECATTERPTARGFAAGSSGSSSGWRAARAGS